MKIRNRIADIKTLQAHILQDYFSMALSVNFIDDIWKSIFHDEVQKGAESQYRNNYVGAWNKMQLKGLNHYSIDDMDTTTIITILKGTKDGPFNYCKFSKINQYLDLLQDDRNIDAHTTGNEADSELLEWAYGSLHNISKFISAVVNAKDCKVPDDERNSYARKYKAKIESLRLQFENDYKETLWADEIEQSINRDIERIKTSKNPHNTYVEITEQYIHKRDNEGNRDFILYNEFMQTAADAGIVWACSWIGDVYFEGLLTDVDYIKAAEYYEKGFSQLVPQQKLRLASIYINDLCNSSHTKEEGMTIIKSCENPRWKIITYTSKNGHVFYSLQRIKHNS
ncbi:MAG: sel1 repeat family protein [Anaerolineaceae bacterium]|nr:sel1 repeat family protein [Anaerolineaceae bacterium]